MTLKYESEILFDLMKRDGDDTPSDVLPYESELKEKYLEQIEGAYPKLQDYRSEWLNYNMVAHLPADFPIETLSNVTEATVDNVVPYAYKSAILSGNTLVNIVDFNHIAPVIGATISDKVVTLDKSKTNSRIEFKTTHPSLVANKQYTVVLCDVNGDASTLSACVQTNSDVAIKTPFINNKAVVTMDEGNNNRLFYIESSKIVADTTVSFKFMVIEGNYTNADIPYFEGMQSVKLPVLTTTGKNLYNGTNMSIWQKNDITGDVKPNKTYTVSADVEAEAEGRVRIDVKTSDDNIIYYATPPVTGTTERVSTTFTVPIDVKEIFIVAQSYNSLSVLNCSNIQIEESSVATAYEPYKSNILTVNEDVTLRGIGDVKDELNLMTGEVTERIGEVVLDGSEVWKANGSNNQRFFYYCQDYGHGQPRSSNLLSDKTGYNVETEIVTLGNITTTGKIQLSTNFATVAELKEWLSSNPLTVQYQLATESVKTVDLTVTDHDGNTKSIIRPIEGTMHLSTSGETIKPTFSGEIPVEAITQNLASFIEG